MANVLCFVTKDICDTHPLLTCCLF